MTPVGWLCLTCDRFFLGARKPPEHDRLKTREVKADRFGGNRAHKEWRDDGAKCYGDLIALKEASA